MSDDNRIPLRNQDGYIDLTAHEALTKVMRESTCVFSISFAPSRRLLTRADMIFLRESRFEIGEQGGYTDDRGQYRFAALP